MAPAIHLARQAKLVPEADDEYRNFDGRVDKLWPRISDRLHFRPFIGHASASGAQPVINTIPDML